MIIFHINLLDAGVKKRAGVPVSHQLSELLQVMIAYDHLPLEGLAAGGVRLLLQLVMQALPPQAASDLCSGYLWFLSHHLLKDLQVSISHEACPADMHGAFEDRCYYYT